MYYSVRFQDAEKSYIFINVCAHILYIYIHTHACVRVQPQPTQTWNVVCLLSKCQLSTSLEKTGKDTYTYLNHGRLRHGMCYGLSQNVVHINELGKGTDMYTYAYTQTYIYTHEYTGISSHSRLRHGMCRFRSQNADQRAGKSNQSYKQGDSKREQTTIQSP
jgi:hypothetical protein